MTPPLGTLETPQGSNFMKDFPGVNATNLDKVDAYVKPCLTSHPLKQFTPDLDGTSGKPVLGTGGSQNAYYYEVFDQVYMWGEFRFGSAATSYGGGIYFITIPFNARSLMGISATFDFSPIVGVGTTHDNSSNAGRLPVTVHLKQANQLQFGIRMNSGSVNRELRSAGYITWDVLDGLSWNARLQRIP